MTIEKLKELEPIFGSWYVDSKLAEGRKKQASWYGDSNPDLASQAQKEYLAG